MFAIVVASISVALGASVGDDSCLSIRSAEPRLADAISIGCADSTTFRRLAMEVDQLRGLVYVVSSPGLEAFGVDAALRWRAFTTSDGIRYVWIAVKPNLGGDMLVAAIGHELQHAAEVLAAAPGEPDFERRFRNRSGIGSTVFETDAARQVGGRITSELKHARIMRSGSRP